MALLGADMRQPLIIMFFVTHFSLNRGLYPDQRMRERAGIGINSRSFRSFFFGICTPASSVGTSYDLVWQTKQRFSFDRAPTITIAYIQQQVGLRTLYVHHKKVESCCDGDDAPVHDEAARFGPNNEECYLEEHVEPFSTT